MKAMTLAQNKGDYMILLLPIKTIWYTLNIHKSTTPDFCMQIIEQLFV